MEEMLACQVDSWYIDIKFALPWTDAVIIVVCTNIFLDTPNTTRYVLLKISVS